ncbi:hypothetical protein BT63DRAFT_422530 [Microthyrium microscopicum]|uniref:Uncharacterized protein n=1 Tax=Microthyrium microscopicum TaxID=703497 RepID=A0A6A6UIA6_9PEZI|nr:hypothetical protein BT63DRAFT_422530 [Microthyrium microscopicum]
MGLFARIHHAMVSSLTATYCLGGVILMTVAASRMPDPNISQFLKINITALTVFAGAYDLIVPLTLFLPKQSRFSPIWLDAIPWVLWVVSVALNAYEFRRIQHEGPDWDIDFRQNLALDEYVQTTIILMSCSAFMVLCHHFALGLRLVPKSQLEQWDKTRDAKRAPPPYTEYDASHLAEEPEEKESLDLKRSNV